MRDAVVQGGYDYYTFAVDTVAPISIVVTPLSGDPDLFVSWGPDNVRPTVNNYTWASQRMGVDSVTIPPSDPRACNPTLTACAYHIGVYGFSQNTSFIITAYLQTAAPVELVDGQPQDGQVPTSLTQQYVFYASAGFTSLTVTLSPVYGDPDLYISVNSTTAPGPTSSDYRSLSSTGPEVITVYETDAAVVSKCAAMYASGALCPIFIAVNGFTNSSYSILASSQTAVDLSNGVTFYDTVNNGQYKYYVFHNDDPTSKLSFAVTPYSGDPDVYVSVIQPKPTQGNYTWKAAGIGRDVVEITIEDPNFCFGCNYYIGVTSWTSNASYTIVALQTSYAVVMLVDGQPQLNTILAGETDQYMFYAPVGISLITLTLSPLYGDADVWVNLNADPPGPSSAQYFSINGNGDDIITIKSTDAAYAGSECNPANAIGSSFCVVRIAVTGFEEVSIYSLLASSSNAVLLLDGVSQTSQVNASTYSEFIFEVRWSGVTISLILTPLSGDPDMYVSTTPGANASHYTWKANSMGVDVIQIFPTDSNACGTPCRYYIGVTGFAGPAMFTITGTTSYSTPSLLLNGRPQSALVNTSMYNLYYFDAAAAVPSFNIRVSATYGDPDIYVRLDSVVPTQANAQFRSLSASPDDTLTISTSDPLFRNCTANAPGTNGGTSCRVYIAIYGFTESSYTITASLSNATQVLQEGIPSSGTVNGSVYTFYRFVATALVPYTFTLTPVSGDPDMYISVTNSTPTMYNNTWFGNGLGVDVITINMATGPRVANCPLPCTFYIGVTGFIRAAAYTLLAASDLTLLVDGQPSQGHALPGVLNYYRYRASASPGDLSFLVTQLQGQVQLYVNNIVNPSTGNVVLPTADCSTLPCTVTNYRWTSLTSFDQSSISIRANSFNSCVSCYYIVAVLSNSATVAADYSLVAASSTAVIVLADGIPHSDVVPRGAYEYYRVVVTSPGVDVQIIVTPFYGDPDLYVSWSGNQYPNATSHDASSTSMYNDTLYIQSISLTACLAQASGCSLYIGVYGYTNSSYSIVSRLSSGFNSPIILLNGVPQSLALQSQVWAYFSVLINFPAGTAYSFSIVPAYGDPDMYLTTDLSEPSLNNYNYSSSSAGFDAVIIAPGSTGYCTRCTVMVGVYAFSSTQFTITFSTNTSSSVIPLRDGVAAYGQIVAGTYSYYKLYVDAQAADFSVSLSALSGSPQTYIVVENTNGGQYLLPSTTTFTWSSVTQGASVVRISASDPNFRAPATYVIGVYSPTASAFFVTSSMTHTSMTSLNNGQPQVSYIAANTYAYFTFSPGSLVSTVTIRVSSPSISLYAVSNYDSANSSSLPSATNYQWTSLTDVTNQNIMVINGTTGNVWYTIAALSTAGTSFTITASTQESVVTLIPGAPSSRFSITQNTTQHFRVDITDITKDFIVTVSPLSGDPDLYVSHRFTNPGCMFPPGVNPNPWFPNNVCSNFTWSATSDHRDVLVIRASNPCATPPAAPSCNAALDWQPGPFYIGVFAYQATVFDITVYAVGGVTSLMEGQSLYSITSADVQPVFLLQVPPTTVRPSIRFDFTAFNTTQPAPGPAPAGVQVFVGVCHSGSCNSASTLPGPSTHTWAAFVNTQNPQQSVFIADGDPAYCDPAAGGTCNYYVGVFPDSRCQNAGTYICNIYFSVRATIQDGSGIETIPFQVINGTLATVIDVVPAAPSAATRYELWFGGSTTPGGSLYMELDACSGPAGYIPTMYICGTDCPKPATPNDPSNSGAATVLSAGASGSAFNFRTPPADVLYASVVALSSSVSRAAFPLMTMSESLLRGVEGEESAVTPLPHMRQLNVHNLQPWRRELPFSQFLTMPVSDVASVTYLLKGAYLPTNSSYRLGVSAPQVQLTSAPPAADGHEIMGFEVTWDAAMLYDFVGGPPRALQGVQYTVYYSSGGFPANTVPTTACGLSQSGSQQQVLQSGTHLITDNLLPDTLYEVNVVAYCGDACQAAANIASPSVLVDEIAYAGASIKTPKTPPPTPKPSGSNTGVTVIIVIVVLVAAGVAIGLFFYCRRKRSSRQYQYDMFEMQDAGTYATTGDAYTAME